MSALDLARLRATGAAAIAESARLEPAAARVGRTMRRAGSEVTLARHSEAPAPTDVEVVTSSLPDSALVALGLCVGIAWRDRDRHPYPGEPFTIGAVTEAARVMRITTAASRHVIGAVRNVLLQARLLTTEGGTDLRLGPGVAAWSDADIDAFRRNLDALPQPVRYDQ